RAAPRGGADARAWPAAAAWPARPRAHHAAVLLHGGARLRDPELGRAGQLQPGRPADRPLVRTAAAAVPPRHPADRRARLLGRVRADRAAGPADPAAL